MYVVLFVYLFIPISSSRQVIASSPTLALRSVAVNEVISQARGYTRFDTLEHGTNLANVDVIATFFDVIAPNKGLRRNDVLKNKKC